jgi:hypothetical protein
VKKVKALARHWAIVVRLIKATFVARQYGALGLLKTQDRGIDAAGPTTTFFKKRSRL